VGKEGLPEWYAICSKEGKKVYTVPEEGGMGAVECVVVGGKEVVDTGSLGTYRLPGHDIADNSSNTEEVGR